MTVKDFINHCIMGKAIFYLDLKKLKIKAAAVVAGGTVAAAGAGAAGSYMASKAQKKK